MPSDPRASGLISLVSRIRHASSDWIGRELAARGVEGLAPSHGNILTTLFLHGGCLASGEITRTVHRTKSTVSQLVDGLEKAGYVERRKDPDDARVILVSLTERGKALQSLWGDVSLGLNRRAWKDFSDGDATLLLDLLERLEANFQFPE